MKKQILFVLSMALFSAVSIAQINYDDEMMKGSTLIKMPNQVLIYGVEAFGASYDFIVHVKNVKDGLDFDYEMTNAAHTKGSVHMSAAAIDDAITQNNYFSGGEMKLEDMTTVWVSQKVLMDLIEDGSAAIITEAGENQTKLVQKSVGHDYQAMNAISGEMMNDLSYVYAESLDGTAKYWIHLSKDNPLILKMDLGWTIWLKEMGRE